MFGNQKENMLLWREQEVGRTGNNGYRSIFVLHTSRAIYELKVVLLPSLARKFKDELLDLLTIPLAEFFIDKS
jgi:hypothetical protein